MALERAHKHSPTRHHQPECTVHSGKRDRAPELIRGSQGGGCPRPAIEGTNKQEPFALGSSLLPARPGTWVTEWTGDMGNRFPSSPHRFYPSSFPFGPLERPIRRDGAERHRPEAQCEATVLAFLEADRFAAQALADIDRPALPFDLTGVTHLTDVPVAGIVRCAPILLPIWRPAICAVPGARRNPLRRGPRVMPRHFPLPPPP